jgi:hypothetical protein
MFKSFPWKGCRRRNKSLRDGTSRFATWYSDSDTSTSQSAVHGGVNVCNRTMRITTQESLVDTSTQHGAVQSQATSACDAVVCVRVYVTSSLLRTRVCGSRGVWTLTFCTATVWHYFRAEKKSKLKSFATWTPTIETTFVMIESAVQRSPLHVGELHVKIEVQIPVQYVK